jgi:imidazolonepropionase-like amidohydrolase
LPDSEVLIVDHQGHYAIPGLWDMHVHLRGGPELINANERWLRQYLGFGVTSVRDAGGDLPYSVLHWKAEVMQGDVLGPRLFTSLRKLDGVVSGQPGSIVIDSRESIDRALDNLVFAGADFIKLYDTSFPPELFATTLNKAHARGLKTAAHVPSYVPLRDVIDAGLDSIEHVYFFVKAANPDDRRLSEEAALDVPFDGLEYLGQYATFSERADETYARETFRRMAAHGTAVVPTLAIEASFAALLNRKAIESDSAEQTPSAIRVTHDAAIDYTVDMADIARPIFATFVRHASRFLRIATDEGVVMLAGSDTGADNPGVYPGDSLHAELEQLVAFGLSPLEALRSATLDPARWMGLEKTFGSVSAGAAADVVILESNPLEDIANTRAIAAVIQQGVYFDRAELEDLKTLVGE